MDSASGALLLAAALGTLIVLLRTAALGPLRNLPRVCLLALLLALDLGLALPHLQRRPRARRRPPPPASLPAAAGGAFLLFVLLPDLLLRRAWSLSARGRGRAAERWGRAALWLSLGGTVRLDLRVFRLRRLLEEGAPEEAAAVLDALEAARPRGAFRAIAAFHRLHLLQYQGRPDELLRRHAALPPDLQFHPATLALAARALAETGRREEAAAAFEAAWNHPDAPYHERSLAAAAAAGAAAPPAARGEGPIPPSPYWPVTAVLILTIGLLGGVTGLFEREGAPDRAFVTAWANDPTAVGKGEGWRLLSSVFIHAHLLHLFLNLWAIYVMGRFVEQVGGGLRMAAVFVGSGALGSLASHLFTAKLSLGASGGAFGLMGAALFAAVAGVRRFTRAERLLYAGNLLFLVTLNLVLGFTVEMVDNAAHIGGLAGGLLLSAALFPPGDLRLKGRPLRAVLAAILLAAALCALAWTGYHMIQAVKPERLRRAGRVLVHATLDLLSALPGAAGPAGGFVPPLRLSGRDRAGGRGPPGESLETPDRRAEADEEPGGRGRNGGAARLAGRRGENRGRGVHPRGGGGAALPAAVPGGADRAG